MKSDVLYSHKSDEWSTPQYLYDFFIGELKCFDPCPLNADFDGLTCDWSDLCFINPPFSKIMSFVEKAIFEFEHGRLDRAFFLVPSRTDTKWFKRLYPFCGHIISISGRLRFGNSLQPAPFPCLILVMERTERMLPVMFHLVGRQEIPSYIRWWFPC